MEHKTLVDAEVTAEWEMFSNVQNVGGKASCQMDPKTFRIMRSSQMDNWDDELLGSYLEDLLNARLEGRNLVTEKYARMMESTFPEEYAQLADSLPPLDPEAMAQVDDIVAAHVSWKENLDSRFPRWPTGAAPCAAVTTVRAGSPWRPTCARNCAPIPPRPSPSIIGPPWNVCARAKAKPNRTCSIRCGSTASRTSRARKSISAPVAETTDSA